VKDDNKEAARMVKAAIEKTTLGEMAEFIKVVYAPGKCCGETSGYKLGPLDPLRGLK
jgi:hypothetical protein